MTRIVKEIRWKLYNLAFAIFGETRDRIGQALWR